MVQSHHGFEEANANLLTDRGSYDLITGRAFEIVALPDQEGLGSQREQDDANKQN